jgi:hypothetical protein
MFSKEMLLISNQKKMMDKFPKVDKLKIIYPKIHKKGNHE